MKLKLLLLYFLTNSSLWCFGQSGKLFSTDLELSSSLIMDVYQDKRGIIWIATEDGLNRYDGSKFIVYKHDKKNENSLLNNYVRLVFEDRKGNFFIGYYNGLQMYDYATDNFKEIQIFGKNGERIHPHIITMIQRRKGDILIGTAGLGLFLVEFKGKEIHTKYLQGAIPSTLINLLFEDKEENLWISTEDKGLFKMDRRGGIRNYFGGKEMPNTVISSLCEDKQGNLYGGSLSSGIYKLDKEKDAFFKIPYPPNQNLPVKALFLSEQNQIYIGTDGYGMKIYDTTEEKIKEKNFNVTTFDFTKSKVHAITEDNKGNVWVGLFQKGVMLLPPKMSNFKYLGYKSISENIIGSNNIMSVLKDHEGTLWVGTDNDGIYGIGTDGKRTAHFVHTNDPNSVPSTIMCIYEDSKHNLWIGSYFNGLGKLNRKTGAVDYLPLYDNNSNFVQRIYALVEDKDQNLWIASMGSGLFSLNLRSGKITHFEDGVNMGGQKESGFLHNNWINCLTISKDNKLFIGTYDGLGCLDLKTKSFVSSYGTNHLLPRHIVYSILEDTIGNIWIGTASGLSLLERNTKKISTYSTDDGLPSNVICAIKGDKAGNLWMSTNYGISKMNLKDRSFHNFYSNDGLQGNEFSKTAACIAKDSEIYFGGINGITHFYPSEVKDLKKKLDVRLTDFYIHDKPVKKGMKSGRYEIINVSVMEAAEFNLSHHDNSFSIEFSTLEFNNPERITYLYSLNNQDWINLSPGTNRVTFSDLAPGSYIFKVKAKDYNTFSKDKKIEINIYPAWYLSIWAKIVYLLIVILIVFLIIHEIRHRQRTQLKMQDHLHLEEINEAKLQFFINVSHEIRTPMSLIVGPLKKLLSTDKDAVRQKAYNTINRNSERILLLVNQLMDIQKIDQGQMVLKFQEVEMVSFLKDLCSIFEDQAEAKHIKLDFFHEEEKLNVWIDLKNFDKIILNVLSNAFKFTPENGSVTVDLKSVNNESKEVKGSRFTEIIISDSGIGINESEIERVFERFYQVTNSNYSEGTGIGLHLTQSLVQLHHGTIKAENNKDKPGSSFIIRIPLGHDHLLQEEISEEILTINKSVHPTIPATVLEENTLKIKSKSKRRVMIVDDNDEIRKYLNEELAVDYHIIESVNGREAYSLILEKKPDLVISDVMMPEMTGTALCKKIKQNVNINHIPVILLTAKSEEQDNLEGLDMGADAYLMKPFNMEVLRMTIQNIIKNREILRNSYNGNQQQKDKVQNLSITSADEKLMKKIIDFININMDNSDLNVEMIASQVGISRVHLHRKLKELTNQAPRDLIRNIRLQQAAHLLSTKHVDISQVAYATGFTSLSYFSSAFKELYGVPPTTYMSNQLKDKKSF